VRVRRYGRAASDVKVAELQPVDGAARASVLLDGSEVDVQIAVPGEHMALDAIAALVAGLELGAPSRACWRASPVSAAFPAVRVKGRPGECGLRRLRAPPDGGRRTAAAARPARTRPVDRDLPAAPVLADQAVAAEFRDGAWVADG